MFYPHDISLMSIFSILPQPPTHVSQASAVFSLQRTASSSKAWSNSAMRFLWQSDAICGEGPRDGKSFKAFSGIEMIEMIEMGSQNGPYQKS